MSKKQQQTEEFDRSSLDTLPDQDDEYGDDFIDDEDDFIDDSDEDEGQDELEHKPSFMDRITGGMNLTSKKSLIILGAIALTAVILFVFSPLKSVFDKGEETAEGEVEEESGGSFFSKIGDFFSSETEEDQIDIAVEVPTDVLEFVEQHKLEYPDYEYTYNEMDGSITFTGLNADGVYHDLIYDIDKNLIAEYVDGVEVFNNIVQEPAPEEVVQQPAVVEGEGETVSIDKTTYNNSTISLPLQNPKGEYDEYQNPIETVSKKRLIVQFYKLPLNGKVPMIKALVAESDEVIIFPVTLTQYVELPDKGSTVIEMTVTEGHGAIGYSDIQLVNWQ